MGVEVFFSPANPLPEHPRVSLEVRLAAIGLHRASDTAQPPLDVELAAVVVIDRSAFDVPVGYKPLDILVVPLKYREVNPNLLLMGIEAAELRLLVPLRPRP